MLLVVYILARAPDARLPVLYVLASVDPFQFSRGQQVYQLALCRVQRGQM